MIIINFNMRCKIITLLLSGLFLSCKHHNKIEGNIDNIFVVFYKYLTESPIQIECGMLPYTADIGNEGLPDEFKLFADTILQDKELLKEIEKQILSLKVDTTVKYNTSNVQIQCFINYKDSATDILCLDGFGGICFMNGKLMIDDGELDRLIKKNIGLRR